VLREQHLGVEITSGASGLSGLLQQLRRVRLKF
jgi:hypothetical protein